MVFCLLCAVTFFSSLTLLATYLALDIDPLVEDSGTPPAEEVECGVEELARHYMGNPSFRQIVHEMHDHFDKALVGENPSYEARVYKKFEHTPTV
ncbi:hypothetical protein PHYSODRAFT_472353 [Phytophthora sojae]|uniref:Uncharacterized protein n=1 Tax=Phytophthora sojae (strain P6497) TaxID=1094619 RepID=G4YQA0_PHYSP|nr:hypothetical protein PHYSODRAFT_472353 [Phytophthora sojae]EGZ29866.1 hypothetical protein PHYSODRAFT_472353 [Phytophthora sojae]|eukprot:XP_009517141.1 hypothetical protein PHYSODRAFT_472353 [Phytophthora sojae]